MVTGMQDQIEVFRLNIFMHFYLLEKRNISGTYIRCKVQVLKFLIAYLFCSSITFPCSVNVISLALRSHLS